MFLVVWIFVIVEDFFEFILEFVDVFWGDFLGWDINKFVVWKRVFVIVCKCG